MTTVKQHNLVKLILFGLIFLLLLSVFSLTLNPVKWFEDKRIQNRNARLTQLRDRAYAFITKVT